MALINPKTGSTKFNAVVTYNAVISLASEEPEVIEQDKDFKLKLLSDATNGDTISHKELQEVPDDEIDAEGYWIHSQAARLKNMTQEELIAMVLKLQGGAATKEAPAEEEAPAEDEAEEEPTDAAEEPEEEEAKPAPKKRKKKRPAPKKDDDEGEDEEETEEVAF